MISRALSLSLLLFTAPLAGADTLGPSVVYGRDDRVERHEAHSAVAAFTAEATVAFFAKNTLQDNGDGTTTVLGKTYGEENNLCPEERFFSQPAGAFCSGILIDDNTILTAGHCVEKDFCEKNVLAFHYEVDTETRDPRKLRSEDVVECSVVAKKNIPPKGLDFALITIAAKARALPVVVSRDPPSPGQEVTMTGYPAGLPMKVVEGAKVAKVGRNYARIPLDAFGGNSGSPVVDMRSGDLLGILVGGEDDFEKVPARGCQRVRYCAEKTCKGEEVLNISAIMRALSEPR